MRNECWPARSVDFTYTLLVSHSRIKDRERRRKAMVESQRQGIASFDVLPLTIDRFARVVP